MSMSQFDSMTDDQLAYLVAEARGCKPVLDAQIVYCPCPSMPHGVHIRGNHPRLHKFPRDIMLGFLRGKEKDKEPDGVTVCRVIISPNGTINIKMNHKHQFNGYSFAVLMRGAAKEIDDHYEGECRYHSKTMDRFERDIDDMMGGADGVGQTGS